jgi:DoxX-like family
MVTDGRHAADVTKPRGQRSHSACPIRHADKEHDMNLTLEGTGALSPMDLSMPRSRAIVIVFWIVTALFCLQIGFTAYAQLRLPQVAEAFTRLGFPDYFRVELAWAKLLGVVLLLAPVPARLKEWAYAGFAITLGSALIAHLAVGDGPEAWGFAAGTSVLWGLSYFFWRRVAASNRNMN